MNRPSEGRRRFRYTQTQNTNEQGARINEKYHDTSVLLTEQINVQLRIFENCCRSAYLLPTE